MRGKNEGGPLWALVVGGIVAVAIAVGVGALDTRGVLSIDSYPTMFFGPLFAGIILFTAAVVGAIRRRRSKR